MSKIFIRRMSIRFSALLIIFILFFTSLPSPPVKAANDLLRSNFLNLPLSERLTMPLFWQHGEDDATLTNHVDRMFNNGCGSFVIESRPHPNWLGQAWFDDCRVILDYARTKGMNGWIFDEKWWPSFDVAGTVPVEHRARALNCSAVDVTGPQTYNGSGYSGSNYVKAIAGKQSGSNLSLGKAISASTTYGPGYEASKANDGDAVSRWNADAYSTGNEWLEINFGVNTTFDNTIIRESFDRITSYNIKYWNGTAWVDCVTGTTIGSAKTDNFAAVTASKVRLYINTATGSPSINEFEVYNGAHGIDGTSLVDLAPYITNGNLSWSVPSGTWKIMKFTWSYQGSQLLDLTTQSAADWFANNVIKPHYDNTGSTNIAGFFYDEPEYYGTWGLGMEGDSADWKQIMVSRFYQLSGEDQGKAAYEYWEALGERMGRVGYGTYRNFLNSRGGKLTGHGNEENAWGDGRRTPLSHGWGQINMMEVQKYQDIPGIDIIGGNIYRQQKPYWVYQLPKLAGSIAITNNLANHYALCEIFGAYGWGLTDQDRKWIADWCQVQGVNVQDPHAVNPKGSISNPDPDCPPFYLYTGDEANWPNFKAWCERQNRLSYMLSGNNSNNYSCAQVAVLWPGYSKYVGAYDFPYNMQTALEDVNYDHHLLTYSRFESTATLNAAAKQVELYNSKYKILVMPAVEYIPYATLNKVKQFYDNGGIVIGWERVPTKSAKFGASDSEVQSLSTYLWNSTAPATSTTPIKSNSNGGKTYFVANSDLAGLTTNIRSILSNSYINSDFRVMSGNDDQWLVYNHRVRSGSDVYMIWNGATSAKNIVVRLKGTGTPEIWNPTTMSITTANYIIISANEVDVTLSIPAEESYLVVFNGTPGPTPTPTPTGTATATPTPTPTATSTATPGPVTNLALNKTITASSFFGTGYEAVKANDGDLNSRWNAASLIGGNQWLEIDFGINTTFNKTILREALNRITSYNIQYWNGSAWVNCVTGTTIGTAKTDTFGSITASKVRLYVNTVTVDSPSIYEFEVYNEAATDTPAPRISATASSTVNGSWPAGNAIDNNTGNDNGWSSVVQSQTGSQWISVDMGANYNINKIKLIPRTHNNTVYCFPQDFKFQSSPDGTTWTDIAGQSYTNYPNPGNNNGEIFNLATPVSARQIRLVGTKFRVDDFSNYYLQICEIYLYCGTGSATLLSDDFSGDLSKWQNTANASISGGELTLTNNELMRSVSGGSNWTDYTFQADVKITGGCAGLTFRSQDDNNYYMWQLNSNGNFRPHKKVGGSWTVLKEVAAGIMVNTTYTVKIEAIGNTIKTYLNGNLIDTTTDSAVNSGKVGFRQAINETAVFDNVVVTSN